MQKGAFLIYFCYEYHLIKWPLSWTNAAKMITFTNKNMARQPEELYFALVGWWITVMCLPMCRLIGVIIVVLTQLNLPSMFIPWRQCSQVVKTYLNVLLAFFWKRWTFAGVPVVNSSSPANDGSSLAGAASFFALPASAHVKTSFAFILYCWRVLVSLWTWETPFGKFRHVELDYVSRAQLKHHYRGNNHSKHHLCRIKLYVLSAGQCRLLLYSSFAACTSCSHPLYDVHAHFRGGLYRKCSAPP